MQCKCGSTKFFTQTVGNNVGIYCKKCGIRAIGNQEVQSDEKTEPNEETTIDSIKSRAVELWSALHQAELSYEEYVAVNGYIVDLFLSDN